MFYKKLDLLIFTKSIDGGTGRYVIDLYQLKKNPFDNIKIICLEKPEFRKVNLEDIIFYRKKNFYPKNFFFNFFNIKNFIKDCYFFYQIIKNNPSSIVLGVDLYCNLIISLYKTLFNKNVKIILTTHINIVNNINNRTDWLLKKILYKMINYFYNKADKLVFVSRQLLDYICLQFNLNKKKSVCIYNGIDLNKKRIKIINKNKLNKLIIITIGRLVHQKDHLTLIKAFNELLKENPTALLWILSDGYLKKDLLKLVKELKITKNVKFFGWVKNIDFYLNKASIFVLSTKNEGFGYVLIEAMKHGLPVIASDVDFGPREILKNGQYGFLVKPNDYQDLKNKINKLILNKNIYQNYIKRSLMRVKDFDIKIMLYKYKQLFYSINNNS